MTPYGIIGWERVNVIPQATPLIYATKQKGNLVIVKFLVENGAEIDGKDVIDQNIIRNPQHLLSSTESVGQRICPLRSQARPPHVRDIEGRKW